MNINFLTALQIYLFFFFNVRMITAPLGSWFQSSWTLPKVKWYLSWSEFQYLSSETYIY